MYICMLALVLMLAGLCLMKKENGQICFLIALCCMTLFLALRYGQGSDYWGYRNLFVRMPDTFDFNSDVYNSDMFHGEIGWKLLMNACRVLGMNFETVIMLVAFLEMTLIAWALERFCSEEKMLGLVILFPTVYLTYFFSTLRQGFVIPFTLTVLLPLLQKRKYVIYTGVVLALCLIHKSSLLLLLPLALTRMELKHFHFLLAFCGAVGALLCLTPVWDWIHQFVLYIYPALGEEMVVTVNIAALGERILTGGVAAFLFERNRREGRITWETEILYKTYGLANMFYFLLMGSRTLAGRFCMLFKCVEIVLIPMLLQMYGTGRKSRTGRLRVCVYLYCMFLTAILSVYHLGHCSEEGNYYRYYNAFEYPYISVFQENMVYELFDTENFD